MLLLILLVVSVALVGCGPTVPVDPIIPGGDDPGEETIPDDLDLSGVTFKGLTVTYDGEAHSLAVTGMPSDSNVTVKYTGNDKTNAGEHTVTAKFYYKDLYIEGKDLTAKLVIRKADYDMYGVAFDGMTVVYDGAEKSIEIPESKLPSGLRATYAGNGVSSLGTHTVTATFVPDENHNVPASMTATIRIIEGPAGLGGVIMPDMTEIYSASSKNISYSGSLGAGYSFKSYENNSNTNAGEYEVVAVFETPDGDFTISSTQTIKPKRVFVSAEDKTVEFNGERHSIELVWQDGKPDFVTEIVAPGNNSYVIGEHDVTFSFVLAPDAVGNYLFPDVTAKLTINPGDYATEGLVIESVLGTMAVTGYTGDSELVVIPKTFGGRPVSLINVEAFRDNTNIKYVYIPDSVTSISRHAFHGCTSLELVRFGNIKVLGAYAFGNTAITEIYLPDSLVAIEQSALASCDKLEEIRIPFIGGSKNTSNAYFGFIFGASAHVGNGQAVPASLKKVVISDKETEIDPFAFRACSGIEEIYIGSGVTEIGIEAFRGCTSLKSIYIPATVKAIPADTNYSDSPFYECSSELHIVIGHKAVPSIFGSMWSFYASDDPATKVVEGLCDLTVGKTYQEYLELIEQ